MLKASDFVTVTVAICLAASVSSAARSEVGTGANEASISTYRDPDERRWVGNLCTVVGVAGQRSERIPRRVIRQESDRYFCGKGSRFKDGVDAAYEAAEYAGPKTIDDTLLSPAEAEAACVQWGKHGGAWIFADYRMKSACTANVAGKSFSKTAMDICAQNVSNVDDAFKDCLNHLKSSLYDKDLARLCHDQFSDGYLDPPYIKGPARESSMIRCMNSIGDKPLSVGGKDAFVHGCDEKYSNPGKWNVAMTEWPSAEQFDYLGNMLNCYQTVVNHDTAPGAAAKFVNSLPKEKDYWRASRDGPDADPGNGSSGN